VTPAGDVRIRLQVSVTETMVGSEGVLSYAYRMTLPYRLARGLAVVLAIVATHFVLAWLFDNMRLRAPDLGPVFATIIAEPSPAEASPTAKNAPRRDPDTRATSHAPEAAERGSSQ
jgi:hypothetical protein